MKKKSTASRLLWVGLGLNCLWLMLSFVSPNFVELYNAGDYFDMIGYGAGVLYVTLCTLENLVVYWENKL